MLNIDGSIGEGGGQIVRTALALSIVTGTPVRLFNIRAGRGKPGLLRQHLTAVRAAAEVCDGEAGGAQLGSRELRFRPGKVRGGDYRFAVGTAGSATLVLQTVLPPLLLADGPSKLTLEGGTHNPYAPPVDFLARAFLPLVERMGPRVAVRLERHGFYPAGGGRFTAHIEPAPLAPLHLPERGNVLRCEAEALVAGLPRDIAERELAVVRDRLGWPEHALHVRELPRTHGPGNALLLTIDCDHVAEVFTGFGERGVRAESVAAAAADEALRYLAAGAPVDQHLADQLLLPLALARGGSFVTGPLTEHSRTNRQIIEMFLDVRFREEALEGGRRRVEVA